MTEEKITISRLSGDISFIHSLCHNTLMIDIRPSEPVGDRMIVTIEPDELRQIYHVLDSYRNRQSGEESI
jgi:hypothetical protein